MGFKFSNLLSSIKDAAEESLNSSLENVPGLDKMKGAIDKAGDFVGNLKIFSDDDEEVEEGIEVSDYNETFECVYDEDKGLYALRRKSTKEIVTDWYEDLQKANDACGWAQKPNDDNYYLIDNETGQVPDKAFADIEAFGRELVRVLNEKDHYALYNAAGKKVFGWMNDIGKLQKNGYCLVENKQEEYAVIDEKGNLVCEWGEKKAAKNVLNSK